MKRTYGKNKGEKRLYDKGLSVLEQYGLEAMAVYRGRGALICDTEEGRVLIREFSGTQKKLEYQAELLKGVSQTGEIWVDEILANQDGSYLSFDKENIPYIVKRWYQGKECDTRNESDIYAGVSAMADLHKVMQMPLQAHYVKESLRNEFQRHNAELRKIRKFVLAKRKKNDFEFQFLDSIEKYLYYGEESLKSLESSKYEDLKAQALEKGTICHGNYNQHNVWILEENTKSRIAVTNFEGWNYDIQMADLYQFMRKILEKHDWDLKIGKTMLEKYQAIKPLSEEELENLKLRFSYPEKYWKLANYYYTHNKAWISEKNLEKLEKLTAQHENWRSFVEKILCSV